MLQFLWGFAPRPPPGSAHVPRWVTSVLQTLFAPTPNLQQLATPLKVSKVLHIERDNNTAADEPRNELRLASDDVTAVLMFVLVLLALVLELLLVVAVVDVPAAAESQTPV